MKSVTNDYNVERRDGENKSIRSYCFIFKSLVNNAFQDSHEQFNIGTS